MTIRRILTAALCCFMLAACGDKAGTKVGTSNTTDNNENNSNEPNNESNVTDPCAGLELCDASGLSCEGNTHVVCQVNSDSCIVKTSEIDCVSPQVCDDTLGCVDPSDCTDDADCAGGADGDTSCDGTELIECAVGADGCLDATVTDCADNAEVCDDGDDPAMCVANPNCGDGMLDAGEGCDDGNNVDGDGCSATCMVEAVCGDGNLDAGEGCDDGNNVDGDGCSATCVVEASCGDNNLDAGEQCDDGNNVDGDGCDANCMLEPFCGDNNVDAGEQCDDGNNVDGDGCDANCMLEPFCGDNNVDAGEQCDDGNNVDGDGCDANCMLEAVCGDGNLDAGEGCDDGNNVDGDGCNANCQPELGYDCDASGCTMWPDFDPQTSPDFTSSTPPEGGVVLTSDGSIYDCTIDANTAGDPEVTIYDSNGTVVASSTGAGDAFFWDLTLPAGNYYMEVTSAGATPLDAFIVRCLREPIDLGMITPSTNLSFGTLASFGRGPLEAGNTHIFTFEVVNSDQMVSIDASAMNAGDDFELEVHDDQGNLVHEAAVENSNSTNVFLTPGRYNLIIRNRLATALALATYTLIVSSTLFTPFNFGSFGPGTAFPNLNGGSCTPGQAFFLEFIATAAIIMTATLNGWSSGDMNLFVRGPTGILGSSTTAGFDTVSNLALVAGTYYLVLLCTLSGVNAHAVSGGTQ